MNIETNFWGLVGVVGVVVGLVLTIPLNIASNLLTPRVINYLERRKIIKSHRSKEQELANYKRVDAFKNGTIYILLATATVICAVGVATCLVLAVLGYGDFTVFPNPLLLLAFLLGVFATLFMVIIAGTARQIEQFEQYKAEIRKKWGDHVISNSEKSLVSAAVMLQPDDEIGHANGE
jgi:fatty acid desaturase